MEIINMTVSSTPSSVSISEAICRALPSNYDFQIEDVITRARKLKARHIGLQFPDGLLLYATTIADIIRFFADSCEVTVLGDVVYGACCIDDLTARSLGVDFLVHFGHSCLVPVDQTTVRTMYVLVRIKWEVTHLIDSILANFTTETQFSLQGTVQFSDSLEFVRSELERLGFDAEIPQSKPLGPGETLGCTSPFLRTDRTILFVADGRFHLEAAMMANPNLAAFRYDPYVKRLFRESFDNVEMKRIRGLAVKAARKAKCVGLILGTLGRQGSVGLLEGIRTLLQQRGVETFTVLMSEVENEKLGKFGIDVDAWVQVACPRLSIDWGEFYSKPLLSSFEAFACWGEDPEAEEMLESVSGTIPMDYYSNDGGPWANYTVLGGYGGTQTDKFWHMGPGKKLLKYETEQDARS